MRLHVTNNKFNPNPCYSESITNISTLPPVESVALFDQNGYDLTKLEQSYAMANRHHLTIHRNKDLIREMETFDINNPMWIALTNLIEATTNMPLARLHNKALNLSEAFNADNDAWQRIALGLGWSRWELGVTNEEIEQLKEIIKEKKKQERKKTKTKKPIIF